MRFLSKVYFINSATIPFAEVLVNGNVHLIGTQGVGKSTLLRAILFFYNADSLKLGISKEKRSFADYYFPNSNSYVIYEVERETGPFCVVVSKNSGKVGFRFIEAAFDKSYFLSPDGIAFEKWEQTRKELDKANKFYSSKIETHGDYKNVIYGYTDVLKKDLSRFYVMQSKQYQNIPRTIQNVFLNSKLDAEFIKQTIINSLNEEDVVIDLSSYSHHLKDFERQLGDIHKYKEPGVRKIAEQAIERLVETRLLEKEKTNLALQLNWAANHTTNKIPKLKKTQDSLLAGRQKLVDYLDGVESRHQNKIAKLHDEITTIDHDLKRTKERSEFYRRLDIENILRLSEERPSLEIRLQQLTNEKRVLTSKFGEISQKYQLIVQNLQNTLARQQNEINSEQTNLASKSLTDERENEKHFRQAVEALRYSFNNSQAQTREKLTGETANTNELKIEQAIAKSKTFLADEIRSLELKLTQLQNSLANGTALLQPLESQQQAYQKELEAEQLRISLQANMDTGIKQRRLEDLRTNLDSIQKLLNNKESFYYWLSANKPGWEQNIGKTISQNLLEDDSLSPAIIPGVEVNRQNFFGVSLDLSDVESPVSDPARLEADQHTLKKEIANIEKQLRDLLNDTIDKNEKLNKKFSTLVKKIRDALTRQRFEIESGKNNLRQILSALEELRLRSKQEKDEYLKDINSRIELSLGIETATKKELADAENDHRKQIQLKQKELDRKLEMIRAASITAINLLNEKATAETAAINSQILKAREQELDELNGKGVDTAVLKNIEVKISDITENLEQISRQGNTITEYQKDKRELFDKEPQLKTEKQSKEQQRNVEQNKFLLAKDKITKELRVTNELIQLSNEEISKHETDLAAFENFRLSETYSILGNALSEPTDDNMTDMDCRQLIDTINEKLFLSIRKEDELKENVNRFSGYFSSDNIFNFRTTFSATVDYTEFADGLIEFIHNSKIDEYERRVNQRFATIINTVGNQTGALMAKAGEIQKVIGDINHDFKSRNFAGVIRKIELKFDQSVNRVVLLLQEIKKFNDEHSFELGGINLFSTVDQHSRNQKAADLLRSFGRSIVDYKLEMITLADSFELKFRIEENDNDTGWVEKLSNVGSEGTDVLVKAMINIMLLNVFKDNASKKFKDFHLHCMMDEIGKLHPNNVRGILQFANDRNIYLINGSPTENNALDYKHIYKLEKDAKRHTRIKKIITKLNHN